MIISYVVEIWKRFSKNSFGWLTNRFLYQIDSSKMTGDPVWVAWRNAAIIYPIILFKNTCLFFLLLVDMGH